MRSLPINLKLPCAVLIQEAHDRFSWDKPLSGNIRTVDEFSILDIPDNCFLAASYSIGSLFDCEKFLLISHCPGLSSLFILSSKSESLSWICLISAFWYRQYWRRHLGEQKICHSRLGVNLDSQFLQVRVSGVLIIICPLKMRRMSYIHCLYSLSTPIFLQVFFNLISGSFIRIGLIAQEFTKGANWYANV